jgi:hypothetical protein
VAVEQLRESDTVDESGPGGSDDLSRQAVHQSDADEVADVAHNNADEEGGGDLNNLAGAEVQDNLWDLRNHPYDSRKKPQPEYNLLANADNALPKICIHQADRSQDLQRQDMAAGTFSAMAVCD